MRIAIFSDVHGNYVNLESFYLSTKELNINQYVCLGDLCNYYPDSKRVIDFIKNKKITCLMGNHDEMYTSGNALGKEKREAYNFDEELFQSDEQLNFLKSLPLKSEMEINGKSILFCHAAPDDLLNKYIYPDTDLSVYYNIPNDFVFMGHTHRQFLKIEAGKVFCNVGSIGLPRDDGSLMGFVVLDTDKMKVQLFRKKIDIEKNKDLYTDRVNSDVIALLERKEPLNYSYTLLDEQN